MKKLFFISIIILGSFSNGFASKFDNFVNLINGGMEDLDAGTAVVKNALSGGAAEIDASVQGVQTALSQGASNIQTSIAIQQGIIGDQVKFDATHAAYLAIDPGNNGAPEGAGTLLNGNIGANLGTALGTAIDRVGADLATHNNLDYMGRNLLRMAFRRIQYAIDGGGGGPGGDTIAQAAFLVHRDAVRLGMTEDDITLAELVHLLGRFRIGA